MIVTSKAVREPKNVRFGWNQEAEPNLVNGAGLRASPFTSEKIKYPLGHALGQAAMSAVSIQLRRAGAILGTALFLLAATAIGQADQRTIPDFKIHEGKNDRLPKLNTALPRKVQF